ncbi:hypothetical protein C5167_010373 [Papaver somniferum]|uniref:Uncharacterized protein n=1 Tax=Papaver somniferum TaxID=3469 RepID=A0A4Y7K3Y1_PAPSO|nr:hypothetical protein C5167_010373 [Papaver somniferum]
MGFMVAVDVVALQWGRNANYDLRQGRYVNGAGGQLGAYGSADYDVQCIAVAKIPEVRYCDECHFACYVYVEHNIITGYSGTSCQDDSVNAGAYVCTCCA